MGHLSSFVTLINFETAVSFFHNLLLAMAAAQVYAEELSAAGYGVPLWRPSPTESGQVLIGDVGYLEDGGWYRLFNATLPPSDPINGPNMVPYGFQELIYPQTLLKNEPFQGGKALASKGIISHKLTTDLADITK